MKEKDKVLQALCDGLGEKYEIMMIDLGIERYLQEGF